MVCAVDVSSVSVASTSSAQQLWVHQLLWEEESRPAGILACLYSTFAGL